MINNSDNYLMLKQLLVVLRTLWYEVDVVTEVNKLSIDGVVKNINLTVDHITENFTVPYQLLKDKGSAIDFGQFVDSLNEIIKPASDLSDDLNDSIVHCSDPEHMVKMILDYPVMSKFTDEYGANYNGGARYDNTEEIIKNLTCALEAALVNIKDYAQGSGSKTLPQVLITVNIVELVDRLFQFTNDFHGGSDAV